MNCDICTKDCPINNSRFLDRLEESLRSMQQGFCLPEVIVQSGIRQNDNKIIRMTEIYCCFGDGEFDKVDHFWATGQGYICGILRDAFSVWRDKGLEDSNIDFDRGHFSKIENRKKDRDLVEKHFKGEKSNDK